MYKGQILDEKLLEKVRGKEIFFIPQTINSLNPLLKTAKQARMTLKKSDYKRQEAVYRSFGLGDEVDKMYPFELSGGMARRVLVSDAILSNADLIIADEPTPGMDKKATDEIISYFKSLKKEGKTSLIISHDINMALNLADRIAIFYDGRIIEVSPVEAFENGGENPVYAVENDASINIFNPGTIALRAKGLHGIIKCQDGANLIIENNIENNFREYPYFRYLVDTLGTNN